MLKVNEKLYKDTKHQARGTQSWESVHFNKTRNHKRACTHTLKTKYTDCWTCTMRVNSGKKRNILHSSLWKLEQASWIGTGIATNQHSLPIRAVALNVGSEKAPQQVGCAPDLTISSISTLTDIRPRYVKKSTMKNEILIQMVYLYISWAVQML